MHFWRSSVLHPTRKMQPEDEYPEYYYAVPDLGLFRGGGVTLGTGASEAREH